MVWRWQSLEREFGFMVPSLPLAGADLLDVGHMAPLRLSAPRLTRVKAGLQAGSYSRYTVPPRMNREPSR